MTDNSNDLDGRTSSSETVAGGDMSIPTESPPQKPLSDLVRDLVNPPPERQSTGDFQNIRLNNSRPVVGGFIARWLTIVFLGQIAIFTCAYVIVVALEVARLWNAPPETPPITFGTEAILTAVQVILPVTTTILGVIIGYYFRTRDELGEGG
jgi:hypothetical protein